MKPRIALLLVLLLPGFVLAEGAASTHAFDTPTLRLHQKAEKLYREGHWARAYSIYVNDLASLGDKYAQYMAGYMCQTGNGVARDAVQASAWYRLAAEGGAPEFIDVRDRLLETLSDAERAASDAAYLALRQEYNDVSLAFGHLRTERDRLSDTSTGSLLSANVSPMTIIDMRTGVAVSRAEYTQRLESSMQLRLDYITDRLGIDRLEPDMSDREFAELSRQVDAYLQVIDDR